MRTKKEGIDVPGRLISRMTDRGSDRQVNPIVDSMPIVTDTEGIGFWARSRHLSTGLPLSLNGPLRDRVSMPPSLPGHLLGIRAYSGLSVYPGQRAVESSRNESECPCTTRFGHHRGTALQPPDWA
jgi:hypothetical protein